MFQFSRKNQRITATVLLFVFVQSLLPYQIFALTSGPAQPETQQFSPSGLDNMVDPFTGDFSYSIPLMEVGGYPININYAAGITPDQEASWVGLGWNLNVGAITRNMRGLPDDFAGDEVSKEYAVKANQTFGLSGSLGLEFYGFEASKLNIGFQGSIFYNTYNGISSSVGINPSVGPGKGNKSRLTGNMGLNATLGSESGLQLAGTAGIGYKMGNDNVNTTLGANVGSAYGTREGLKSLTFGLSNEFSASATKTTNESQTTGGSMLQNSASIGYTTPSYTPFLEHNTYNVNGSLKGVYSVLPNAVSDGVQVGVSGFYSGEFLEDAKRTIPAYGYMYSGVTNSTDKLMDFNRENDRAFQMGTTHLPVTNYTHDIFNVSGEGISGSYRLFRGDVGSVADVSSTSTGHIPNIGVEVGAGVPPLTFEVGVDAGYAQSNSYSGAWKDKPSQIKNFNRQELNKRNQEMAYFKRIGDMAPETDCEFFDKVQVQYDAIKHTYGRSSGFFAGDKELSSNYNNKRLGEDYSKPIEDENKRTVRRLRNTPFTALTAEEAMDAEILPIQNYPMGAGAFNFNLQSIDASTAYSLLNTYNYDFEELERVDDLKKKHHLSELRVTNPRGTRYIYGLPVYTKKQEEVTFSVNGGGNSNIKSGMKGYTNKENSLNNESALDHSYTKITTPGYAHSFLLTSILSDDYIDSDDISGPSDGDRGTYTKFNYSKLDKDYNYRTPFSLDGKEGNFSAGMLGTSDDNKVNYVYGEKEIWYMHSIETRTHVAEFYLKDRHDGFGALDKNGGINTQSGAALKYLDKIILYSKSDKRNTDPEPIKTVHFEYDYSLCPWVPNNDLNDTLPGKINEGKGKLTLKKVWFTYGRSEKGVLNPYVFTYADKDFDGEIDLELNPDYKIKNYDRWGNFKLDDDKIEDSNSEYPYVNQDYDEGSLNASVYALSSIKLPTGGDLRVYYESDDYGYVQNKRAMRMFRTVGFSSSPDDSDPPDAILYTGNDKFFPGQKEYLVIDLGEDGYVPSSNLLSDSEKNAEFRKRYLSGLDLMYFKMHLKVLNKGARFIDEDRFELVPGYAEIESGASSILTGSLSGGAYHQAKIKLKGIKIDDLNNASINPIVKYGWMFARLRLNREVYGNTSAEDNQLLETLYTLLKTAATVGELFTNFSEKMIGDGSSNEFTPKRSFVRLNEPDKIKLGGGHRVKAIVSVDNWGLMRSSSEAPAGPDEKQTSFYGQKYAYTLVENSDTISSGIAAYEPIIGGDENPFKLPVPQREKTPLIADKEYYLETPFGESFYPPAVVGYRAVNIIPIKVQAADLDVAMLDVKKLPGNGSGYVKHEFYTSYDFPTKPKNTNIEIHRHKPNIILQFMKFDSHDVISCSQGYAIELNDMHGKPKAMRVFPDFKANPLFPDATTSAPISEVEYYYKVNGGNELENEVTTINQDLTVAKERIGVNVDVVQDQRFSETQTIGGALAVNVKVVIYGIFPVITVIPYPDVSVDYTRFRSVVTTKVINKNAVLDQTLFRDNGSTIVKKNLAWDAKTAEVVLTETQNEFHDPIYEFKYPGHWAYQRVGLAAFNEGFTFDNSTNVKSSASLIDGDEVHVEGVKGYYHVSNTDTGRTFIDKAGFPFALPDNTKAKVVRSGSRNSAFLQIGTVKTLKNPIKGDSTLEFDEIVNARMMEYKDEWDKVCRCEYQYTYLDGFQRNLIFKGQSRDQEFYMPPNPFVVGERGVLRIHRNWTYLVNRTQSNINNNVNIRKDGTFENYSPFWVFPFVSPPEIITDDMINPCTDELYVSGHIIKDPEIENNTTNWQFVKQVEKYNSTGLPLEEKDPLNRFTMAQYGYGRNLQVSTSNNSKYQETAFDGFEDYDFEECEDDHMSWRDFKGSVTNAEAHTGKKSIRVLIDKSLKITKTNTGYCIPQQGPDLPDKRPPEPVVPQ